MVTTSSRGASGDASDFAWSSRTKTAAEGKSMICVQILDSQRRR